MKKIFFIAIALTFFLNFLFITLYNIPRNNTEENFHKLKYGDSFVITMLKLGKPTKINDGGNGTVHCSYKLNDESQIYISFNRKLLYLISGCKMENNTVITSYVKKTDNIKSKILWSFENSFLGYVGEVLKNIFIGFLIN